MKSRRVRKDLKYNSRKHSSRKHRKGGMFNRSIVNTDDFIHKSIFNTDNELNHVLQQLGTIQIHETVLDKVIEKYKKIQHLEDEKARILSKKRKKKLQVEIDSLRNEITETGTDFEDLKKREKLLLSKNKLEHLRSELLEYVPEPDVNDLLNKLSIREGLPDDVEQIISKSTKRTMNREMKKALEEFTKFLTGKVFTEDRNVDHRSAISEAETLNFVLSMSKTKSLEIYEYYDGIEVSIDNGLIKFVYLYDSYDNGFIFKELGKVIPLINSLKSLSYNTRFSDNVEDMSWLKDEVKGLKSLEIPALANLNPSVTNGLDVLILTHPLTHEKWSPKTDRITLGHKTHYSNIKKVIIYTDSRPQDEANDDTDYILKEKDMRVLRRRFPDSKFVFES